VEVPVSVPRHPGSRDNDRSQNLIQVIRRLRADLARMENRVRPEQLAFTVAAAGSGVAVTSADFTATHVVKLVRGRGQLVVVELLAGTGAGSVVEARLAVPDLGVTGPAAASAAGGTEREIKLGLTLPEAWMVGEGYLVTVEARRVSGSDTTTVRVVRAVHR
jgi:hypothetical protein